MRKLFIVAAFIAAICFPAKAQDKGGQEDPFKVACVFTDHMVLQRNAEAPLWGWAAPGTRVTVIPSWDNKKYQAVAAEDGRWEVKLATPGAGGPYTVTASAGKRHEVMLQDVLVGEVWLCSGQSNMELNLIGATSQGVEGSYEAISEAYEYSDRIRFYDIKAGKSFTPLTDIDCKWKLTDGETAAGVSAVAYFFAKRLTKTLGVPVGIIANPWGGCLLPPWLPMDYMEKYVKGQIPQDKYEAILARRDEPDPNREAPRQVATLYNSRLYPIKGYALSGFVWYQGCSELIFGDIPYYDKLQAAMVRCWRDLWGDKDNELPFYFTLIAPYGYSNPEGTGRGYFVENQLSSLDIIPNSGVAVTETLGDMGCIHPAKKKEVADQFAVLALENVYGIKTGLGNGFAHPDWVSFPSGSSVEARKIHQSGYDIDIRKGTEDAPSITIHFIDTRIGIGHYSDYGFQVKGFEVAGPDQVFHPVPARTLWDTVVIDCSSVPDPVAVRYAFHNWTEGDLKTTLGIPVASFRTDDWPMK
ncbi:MAG: hypothetical protein IJK73_05630 [Bacteroidales bacterium]|nr:hypothetical protein [Bacteroidales bacterium]MBQ6287121.1 hypothetical protein [Bacteroidales bacterium]